MNFLTYDIDKYNYLIETNTATEDEIDLVFAINGQSDESLEDILYVRLGYRGFEQLSDFPLK